MGLVDRGTETLIVYPSAVQDDGYGTPTRRPVDEGVTLERALVLPGGGTETATDGQSAAARFSVIVKVPDEIEGLDAFAEVEWRERRFDVVGVPVRLLFPPKRAGLTFLTLQAR